MPTRWIRAGVRADTEDSGARRRDRAAAALQATLRAERDRAGRLVDLAAFDHEYSRGMVLPYRITWALDAAGQQGPDVDAACGAAEPDVDNWEAGILYPTRAQMLLLAKLTKVTPRYFTRTATTDEFADVWWTSSARFHATDAERRAHDEAPPMVRKFTPEAIRAAGLIYP